MSLHHRKISPHHRKTSLCVHEWVEVNENKCVPSKPTLFTHRFETLQATPSVMLKWARMDIYWWYIPSKTSIYLRKQTRTVEIEQNEQALSKINARRRKQVQTMEFEWELSKTSENYRKWVLTIKSQERIVKNECEPLKPSENYRNDTSWAWDMAVTLLAWSNELEESDDALAESAIQPSGTMPRMKNSLKVSRKIWRQVR